METRMGKTLDFLYGVLWGAPTVILILGAGILLSICTDFPQIRLFFKAFSLFRGQTSRDKGGISPFRSLCIALAATVGTGNLVGVAGAICLGGPGAVFWMLVCAFFGMAVKYAEATLAVRYQTEVQGELVGGTMYIIQQGLGKKWRPLACCYCLLGIAASFGVGNFVQINTIAASLCGITDAFAAHPYMLGMALSLLVGAAFLKGADSIGRVSEWIVPGAAGAYVILCMVILIGRADTLGQVFRSIWLGAFTPKAVTGGVIGSLLKTLQTGCSRGIFSNESGMGTASMAHGSGNVSHPVQQGMIGILEVFFDTFVVCLMTALVILASDIPIPYGSDAGAQMTAKAFSAMYGAWGGIFISAIISFFAFATVLGWSLYGLRCTQFLFGPGAAPVFFCLQTAAVMLGILLNTSQVWRFAEILNGLMVLPNLMVLLFLIPELSRLTREYALAFGRRQRRHG